MIFALSIVHRDFTLPLFLVSIADCSFVDCKAFCAYARISLITLPCTSVSRMSRPLKR